MVLKKIIIKYGSEMDRRETDHGQARRRRFIWNYCSSMLEFLAFPLLSLPQFINRYSLLRNSINSILSLSLSIIILCLIKTLGNFIGFFSCIYLYAYVVYLGILRFYLEFISYARNHCNVESITCFDSICVVVRLFLIRFSSMLGPYPMPLLLSIIGLELLGIFRVCDVLHSIC